jgi:hypothetical protein
MQIQMLQAFMSLLKPEELTSMVTKMFLVDNPAVPQAYGLVMRPILIERLCEQAEYAGTGQ